MITINHDNIESEHLCCIIKKKIKDTGVELKREYIQERLDYYRFVKEDVDGRVFIEYVPLEYALVPVTGNFIYIHCLWVDNPFKHQGYGKELLNECINYYKKIGINFTLKSIRKNCRGETKTYKGFHFEYIDEE